MIVHNDFMMYGKTVVVPNEFVLYGQGGGVVVVDSILYGECRCCS